MVVVFWVVAPCSLVDVYQVSEVVAASIIGAISDLVMEAASISEMSVNFYKTTWRKNPEDNSHLHTCLHENLKSCSHA
jgi:hypothetical protein